MFFVFAVIASELGVADSHNLQEDTCIGCECVNRQT